MQLKETDNRVLDEMLGFVGYHNPEGYKQGLTEWVNLLEELPFDPYGSVAEFGPGISPKLLFALSSTNFQGTLTLVDLDEEAITTQADIAYVLKPAFAIDCRLGNLFDLDLSNQSLVIGNHLIDDLIAADYARHKGLDYSEVFANALEQSAFWCEILENPTTPTKTVVKLSEKLVQIKAGGIVVMNNYLPSFDKKYGISVRTEVCDSMLELLGQSLSASGFSRLQQFEQSPDNKKWLVAQKPVL